MNSRALNRKEFLTLTFTLIGGAATVAACSSSGTYGGSNGTGGTTGGTGACTNPLPEMQVADSTGHVHTVSIPASDLDATADQMINTSVVGGHMHMVTLAVSDLATLKGGGSVTVTSSQAGTPAHSHTYSVSCS